LHLDLCVRFKSVVNETADGKIVCIVLVFLQSKWAQTYLKLDAR
jgi:hypothetical protein